MILSFINDMKKEIKRIEKRESNGGRYIEKKIGNYWYCKVVYNKI